MVGDSFVDAGAVDAILPDKSVDSGPTTAWAISAGGEGYDVCFHCVVVPGGDVLLTGSFEKTAWFGSYALNSQGLTDGYVARLDAQGSFRWATRFGGTDHDIGASIAVGPAGVAAVTGAFRGNASFGGFKVQGDTNNRVFVANLASTGVISSVAAASQSTRSAGRSIAVDAQGNIYVCGGFDGVLQLGTTTLNGGSGDIFIARLSSTGKWDWALAGTGNGDEFCGGLDIDSAGNLFACASTSSTALVIGSHTVSSIGTPTLVMLKIDSAGKLVWGKALASAVCTGLRMGAGGAAITGIFEGTTQFGSTTITSKGNEDAFTAFVDASGTPQWALAGGGAQTDMAKGVAVTKLSTFSSGLFKLNAWFGSTWLSNQGSNDVFVFKQSSNGTPVWAVSAGGSANESGECIGVDGNGDVVVAGTFGGGTMVIGSYSFSASIGDVFVWKLTNTGP